MPLHSWHCRVRPLLLRQLVVEREDRRHSCWVCLGYILCSRWCAVWLSRPERAHICVQRRELHALCAGSRCRHWCHIEVEVVVMLCWTIRLPLSCGWHERCCICIEITVRPCWWLQIWRIDSTSIVEDTTVIELVCP